MHDFTLALSVVVLAGLFQSCAVAPAPDSREISTEIRHKVMQRQTVVIVSSQESLDKWMHSGFVSHELSRRVDGGSATPISHDGYFLTADHVVMERESLQFDERGKPTNIFLLYHHPKGLVLKKARVVWRSKKDDLALLHIAMATPRYFNWAPADHWIPAGTRVMHGGISTGEESSSGEITTNLQPENPFTGNRFFKMDIPLQPGDSGGPVVDADGLLVGVNSAVEFLVPMETAFFVDSEGARPCLRQLIKIIDSDRKRNNPG